MNFRHLEQYIAVARSGSITESARQLHMSQPALSMQLKRLEEELGVPLFTPAPRGITLTDAGKAFLDYAEKMVTLEKQSQRMMEEFRLGRRGSIVIGADAGIATYILPEVLAGFRGSHPEVDIRIVQHPDDRIEMFVDRGDIDIGLTVRDDVDHLSFRVISWMKDRLIGIRHPVSDPGGKLFVPADLTGLIAERWGNAVPYGPIESVETTETAKRMTMAGLGSGIVAHSSVINELRLGLLAEKEAVSSALPALTVSLLTRPAEKMPHSVKVWLGYLSGVDVSRIVL